MTQQTTINRAALIAALIESMTEYTREDGRRPHNAAIMQDTQAGRIYYGSALHTETGHDRVLLDIEAGGLDAWVGTDMTETDSQRIAPALADLIISEADRD